LQTKPPNAEVLKEELKDFKQKISEAGRTTCAAHTRRLSAQRGHRALAGDAGADDEL
jgi:hypothetical protein